ncbi:hypothetical protein IG631_15761 [Alternaria alternata]|nr:hypothetical protein IG631_15761 [Alternaria alternata]
MRESVPRVKEAFLPTASVSGTLSDGFAFMGGGCEGVESSRGSRKGSSVPAIEAMIIVECQEKTTHSMLCKATRTRKQTSRLVDNEVS